MKHRLMWIVVALIATQVAAQAQKSPRDIATIKKDVTYFDSNAYLVVPKVTTTLVTPGGASVTSGALASGQLISTNTIAVLDTGGSALAARTLIRVWMSATQYGAMTTNNTEGLVLSGGAAVATGTANGDYVYLTGTNGQAVATITATESATNYLNVGVGGNVSSTAITLVP